MIKKGHIFNIVGVCCVFALLYTFILHPIIKENTITQLQRIKDQGFIRFVTYNSASTLTYNDNGKDGFEYQLAIGFAEHLDLEAQFIVVDSFKPLYDHIIFNDADLAVAGLSQRSTNKELVRFGPSYMEVTPQVIYKKGTTQFKDLNSFANTHLDVSDNSANNAFLAELSNSEYPKLNWELLKNIGPEEAIEMVNEGFSPYLLVDSHNFALQRRFFPELRIAFELNLKKRLKWMFKTVESDDSLMMALNEYFLKIRNNGQLKQWTHRYLSHVENFNYSDLKTFNNLLEKRLPKYQAMFEKEAKATGLDWRLLAAIGYQESFWDPKAKSPTGVRGLMMLTKSTAKQMGVEDRLDAAQSIEGGAKYLKRVIKKIPERITQPDRTWMALASYNVGFGHLEDARVITQIRLGDPDKWLDVKKSLPLLSQKKWHVKTKYGYARGSEPVKYVENIRKYFDLIVWYSNNQNNNKENTETKEQEETKPQPSKITILPSV